jgi:hypothetical protein
MSSIYDAKGKWFFKTAALKVWNNVLLWDLEKTFDPKWKKTKDEVFKLKDLYASADKEILEVCCLFINNMNVVDAAVEATWNDRLNGSAEPRSSVNALKIFNLMDQRLQESYEEMFKVLSTSSMPDASLDVIRSFKDPTVTSMICSCDITMIILTVEGDPVTAMMAPSDDIEELSSALKERMYSNRRSLVGLGASIVADARREDYGPPSKAQDDRRDVLMGSYGESVAEGTRKNVRADPFSGGLMDDDQRANLYTQVNISAQKFADDIMIATKKSLEQPSGVDQKTQIKDLLQTSGIEYKDVMGTPYPSHVQTFISKLPKDGRDTDGESGVTIPNAKNLLSEFFMRNSIPEPGYMVTMDLNGFKATIKLAHLSCSAISNQKKEAEKQAATNLLLVLRKAGLMR